MRSNTKEQPTGQSKAKSNGESSEVVSFVDDAQALIEATANMSGDKVERARKRLALAIARGKSNGADFLFDASLSIPGDSVHKLQGVVTDSLHQGKVIYDRVHDDVVRRTKAVDHALHEHPYKTMGVAMTAGAVGGFIVSSIVFSTLALTFRLTGKKK